MSNSQLVTITNQQVIALLYETENSDNPNNLTQFSTPGTGANSTYAFGPAQIDVGANKASAGQFLLNNGFTQAQVTELESSSAVSQTELNTLNAELQAIPTATMAAYQEGFVSQWTTNLNNALNALAVVNPAAAASIESSPDDQLALIDFANQYGLSSDAAKFPQGMLSYLEGNSVNPTGLQSAQLTDPNSITPADIANYVSVTKYSINAETAYANGTASTNAAAGRADRLQTAEDQNDSGTSVLPDGYDSSSAEVGLAALEGAAYGLTGDITSSIDSNGNFVLTGANGSITTPLNSSEGFNLNVNSSNSSFNFAAGVNATVQGTGNALQCGANDQLTSGGNTIFLSNQSLNLTDTGGTSNTIEGNGFTVNENSGLLCFDCSGTLGGSGNTLQITSDSTSTMLDGNNTVDMDSGSTLIDTSSDGGNTINGGEDDTIQVTNSSGSDTINASDDAAITLESGSSADLIGNGNTLTGGSGATVSLQGDSNLVDSTGGTVSDAAGDTGNTFNGDQTLINVGANFSGTVEGSGNSVDLSSNSSSSLILAGTDESVTSTGNQISLSGADTSATVTGANAISLGNADESLTLASSGDTLTALAGDTGETLNGSSFTLTDTAGQFGGSVTGGGNTFDLDAGSNSSLSLSGTNEDFDAVNANGVAVTLAGNAQVNITGNSNSLSLSAGDSAGLYGGGNTITASAGEQVVVDDTGGDFDAVNASNDVGGVKVADGEYSGITLGTDSQANITGTGNSVAEATGDAMGVYGGGNTISTGADELLVIGNTDNVFDTVNATGNVSGDKASDGQGTGISLGTDSQANVNGNGNTVTENTGDALGVYGGGNTINAGADELVVVGDTNGDYDVINANDLTGGGTVSDGQPVAISLDGDIQTYVNGAGNTVWEGASDSVSVYGGGNTINAGAGELLWLNDTGSDDDIVNATNDANGGTTANGQGTGIWLGTNSDAQINGSGSDVNIESGDNIALSSGITVDAGANDGGEFISGSGDTVNGGSVFAGFLSGSNDTLNLVANSDSSFALLGTGMVANSTGNAINLALTGSTATIDGASNTVGLQGAGENLTLGSAGDIVNASANDTAETISASGDTINGGTDFTGYLGGSNDTLNLVANSDSSFALLGAGMVANSVGNNLDMGLNGSSATIDGTGNTIGMASDEHLSLGSSGDDITLDGSDDTLIGNDEKASIDGSGDTIDLSHATIDVDGDDGVTIDGSDDKIVGSNGDDFTITGTDDDVDASDSTITFDGTNSGDYVSGSGDAGSNWDDPDGGDGGDPDPGSGYYGYGLTKWKNQSPSAAQIAKAEQSDSVYEGAAWSDKTITWSFASAGGSFSNGITNTAEQTAVEQAFQAWAKASGLNVDEVAAGSKADIEVGFSDLDPAATNEIGLTKYASQGGTLTGANVELEDPSQAALTTNANGQLSYANTDASFEQVALHEIGHALGLADNDLAGSIMNAVLDSSNQSLSAADIADVGSLYGSMATASATDNAMPAAQSLSQAQQLVQAMSTFDAINGGVEDSSLAMNATLHKEELMALAYSHAHAA